MPESLELENLNSQIINLKSAVKILREPRISNLRTKYTKVAHLHQSSIECLNSIAKIIESLDNHHLFQLLKMFQQEEDQLNMTITDAQFRSVLKFFSQARFVTGKFQAVLKKQPRTMSHVLHGVNFYLDKIFPEFVEESYVSIDCQAMSCHQQNLENVQERLVKIFSEENCEMLGEFLGVMGGVLFFSFIITENPLNFFRNSFSNHSTFTVYFKHTASFEIYQIL